MKRYLILAAVLFTACSQGPDFSNAVRSETATMIDSGLVVTDSEETEECVSCAVMSENEIPIDDTETLLTIHPENGITADDISDMLDGYDLEIISDDGDITVRASLTDERDIEDLIHSLEDDENIKSVTVKEK